MRRVVGGGGQRLVVEDDVGDGARVDAELVAEVGHARVAVLRSSGPVTSCAKLRRDPQRNKAVRNPQREEERCAVR